MSKALEELAARMLVSTDGITPTGVKFLGVGALTDELIVVASDALERATNAALGARRVQRDTVDVNWRLVQVLGGQA